MKLFQALLLGGLVLAVALELSLLLQEEKAPVLQYRQFYTTEDITIENVDHQGRNASGYQASTRHEGDLFGLFWHNNFSVLEFLQPASRGRGIASGDFNNDGWQDILLGTNSGALLLWRE